MPALKRVPPLHCLQALDALARLGSVADAADELAVTPSAVSHRLRQLEDLVGQPLVARTQPLALTAFGVQYLGIVRQALTALDALPAPILGHVGDGNFHCAILADPNKPKELEEAERLNQRIVSRALAADGTCTGEHGVGLHKMDFLVEEHGADAIDLMARLKRAYDPLNILNPGKIFRL